MSGRQRKRARRSEEEDTDMISGVSKVVKLELRTGKPAERRVTPDQVGFTQPPVEQPFGSWSIFDDAEGNRFALEQTESDAP